MQLSSDLSESLPYCAERVESYLAAQIERLGGQSTRLREAMQHGLLQGGETGPPLFGVRNRQYARCGTGPIRCGSRRNRSDTRLFIDSR